MATPDDISCLGSICQALRGALASPAGLTRETSDEVAELLALIPQVFSADSHHGRVAQLLHACHPFAAVAPLLSSRSVAASFTLRCAVMDCIKATVAATAIAVRRQSDPHMDKLQHLVGVQLREAEVVPYLLQLLASSNVPVESTAAAELLFVLVMSLPSTVAEDIRRTERGVALLTLHALHGRPAPPQQQVLTCAIVRCLATEYADVLTAPELAYISRSFAALSTFHIEDPSQPYSHSPPTSPHSATGIQSRRAAVLTLETMSDLLTAFPSAYWDATAVGQGAEGVDAAARNVMRIAIRRLVMEGGGTATSGAGALGHTGGSGMPSLSDEASVDEVLVATSGLVRVLLRLEGVAPPMTREAQSLRQLVVFPMLNSPPVYREAAGNAVSSKYAAWRLSLLRCSAFEALQYGTQSPLVSCVLDSFPLLCSLLVPNRSTARCMREAALLISVAMAKSPAARREVQRMVDGYDAWAQQMSARIVQLLAHVFRTVSTTSPKAQRGNGNRNVSLGESGGNGEEDKSKDTTAEDETETLNVPIDLRSLVLVDVYHTVLNDGDQAQHVDLVNEERIARALLHEQDRRLEKATWSSSNTAAATSGGVVGGSTSSSSAPLPLDTEYVEAMRSGGGGQASLSSFAAGSGGTSASRITQRARELSTRLALAVLTEAVLRAFSTTPSITESHVATVSPTRHRSPVRTTPSPLVAGAGRGSPSRYATVGGTHFTPPPPPNAAPQQQASSVHRTPRSAVSPSASSLANTSRTGGGGSASPVAKDPTASRLRPSRYEQWVDEHLGRPQPKTLASFFAPQRDRGPFRPSSAATAAARALSPATRSSPRPRRTSASAHAPPTATSTTPRGGVAQPILDVVRDAPVGSDEYLSMAIMMHLPIRFGPHYNRSGKAAVRKVVAPHGVFVQPIRRSQQQSWSVADVRVGELHVIFIPFSKLSCQRVEEELGALDRHVVELGKLLVTTPNTQRSRRWFLQDMVHEVLPKTELLLRDLLDILYKFGADDVVYQLSIIRVADEGRRQNSGVFANAVEISDTAMPLEILRLSSGSFRDILHSGNMVFAVQQLRQHYYESKGPVGAAASSVHGADGTTSSTPAGASASRDWVALTEVDEEILRLERQQQRERQIAGSGAGGGEAVASNALGDKGGSVGGPSSVSPLRWGRPVTSVPSHLLAQYQRAVSRDEAHEYDRNDDGEADDDEGDVRHLHEDARKTVGEMYRSTQ